MRKKILKGNVLMKKYYAILLIMFTPLLNKAGTNRTSQTFMFTHPVHHTIATTSGAYDKTITHKTGKHCTVIQAIPFYQESRDFRKKNSEKNLNKNCRKSYFLLNCKEVASVKGDNASNSFNRDIRAEWLGLSDTFDGTLSLYPEQRSTGVIITANQDLKAWIDLKLLENWWIDISIPLVNSKARLLTEGSSPEVIDALNRNTLNYARVINCEDEKTGIPEIKLLLGGTYLNENGFLLTYYTGLVIPTEGRPKPTYLFPATLGNNAHFNIIGGINCNLPLTNSSNLCQSNFFFTIENHHYLPNHQWRTVDLKEKQYSRYLPVRKENDSRTVPAANVLTRHVKVSPHSFVDMSTGLEFSSCGFTCEIGYDLWGHGDEQIELRDDCCDTKVTLPYEQYGLAGSGTNSASKSSIETQADDDTDFTTIKKEDLDLYSASGRGAIVHGMHAAFYYNDFCMDHSLIVGLGASYKSPNSNTALKTWGIWGKIGYEF